LPQCKICNKKFSTLDSLEQHHRTVHPKIKYTGPKKEMPKHFYTTIFIIILVAGGGVGYLVYSQLPHGNNNPGILGTPISSDFYGNLTSVTDATLNSVANVSLSYIPSTISGPPLNKNGLPEVLYIGGEFCPFCAGLRWSLSIALSKFGNLSGLEYMLSGVNDGNLSTVTYSHVNFTSSYISFVAIEAFDRQRNNYQPVPSQDQQLWSQYDSSLGIPFLDIGNQYVLLSSPFSPTILTGLSWEQIYSQLDNVNNSVSKQIDAGAASIIAAICKVDGGKPANVCGQPYAQLALLSMNPSPVVAYSTGQNTLYGVAQAEAYSPKSGARDAF